MRIFRFSILCFSLISAVVSTPPAEALEIAVWAGTDVEDFTSSYLAPSVPPPTGVDLTGTGGKIGANITLSVGVLTARIMTVGLGGGYFQFQIKADSGYDIQVDDFQVTTSLAAIGLGTTFASSTTEGGSYSTLASINIGPGTNTYDFSSSPVTIPAGETRFFRLSSVAQVITYDVNQASVFKFNGTVSPVPEPSTYALAAAGVAVLGYAGRKRRTIVSSRLEG